MASSPYSGVVNTEEIRPLDFIMNRVPSNHQIDCFTKYVRSYMGCKGSGCVLPTPKMYHYAPESQRNRTYTDSIG